MNNTKKRNLWLGVGVFAAVSSIAGYLYWKSQSIDSKESVPAKDRKKRVVSIPKTATKSVRSKLNRSEQMLLQLKSGKEYTQIEIQKLTGIPYRTVRRYVSELESQNLLRATGYGKGKRFQRWD